MDSSIKFTGWDNYIITWLNWWFMPFVSTSDTNTTIQSKADVTSYNKSIAFFEVFKFTSAIWMLLHFQLFAASFFSRFTKLTKYLFLFHLLSEKFPILVSIYICLLLSRFEIVESIFHTLNMKVRYGNVNLKQLLACEIFLYP